MSFLKGIKGLAFDMLEDIVVDKHFKLFARAQDGKVSEVQELLRGGADPNSSDDDGTTALMAATCFGHAAVCQILLRARSKVPADSEKTPSITRRSSRVALI